MPLVYGGRTFLRRILDTMNALSPSGKFRLDSSFRSDIAWWVNFLRSLRASSPIWASETSLARTGERAAKPRGARLASLAQIGELDRRLFSMHL